MTIKICLLSQIKCDHWQESLAGSCISIHLQNRQNAHV
uniref:Uncharacterized protein n=1 Tax=Rhizophora mucronata TaxID=61149 RepID=A0A2P2R2G0_RHIMU